MKFIALAEHTAGASVDHPCIRGLYSDPCDQFREKITASSIEEAEGVARDALRELVQESAPCACKRNLAPGSDRWWGSVVITLWPQDQESLEAQSQDGVEFMDDPYGVIPESLKISDID